MGGNQHSNRKSGSRTRPVIKSLFGNARVDEETFALTKLSRPRAGKEIMDEMSRSGDVFCGNVHWPLIFQQAKSRYSSEVVDSCTPGD
jgi:hypothetical protein